MKPRIALIAHDKKKDDMIALAAEYRAFLRGCTLIATGTTGGRLINELGLEVDAQAFRPAWRRPADRRPAGGTARSTA